MNERLTIAARAHTSTDPEAVWALLEDMNRYRSLVAGAANERFRFGPVTVGAVSAQCVGLAVIPVVGDASRPLLVGSLSLSFLVIGLGTAMTNVNVVSLRQTITPPACSVG